MTPQADALIARATTVLSALFVLGVAATAAVIFWPGLTGAGRTTPVPPAPAYVAGETIDTPPEWYAAHPVTLVLVAQAGCGACQKAQPYLHDLFAGLRGRAGIVMASPGPREDVERTYGRSLGLADADVHRSPPDMRARVTPTLLVVNRDGRILGAWEGIGPPEQHAALSEAIERMVAAALTTEPGR